MILEAAYLNVIDGQTREFERDFAFAGQYISSIEGYISHTLQKCIEDPNRYLLLVEWENLESHTIGFRTSEVYLKWKALLHKYYSPFPVVEHFVRVLKGGGGME